MTLPFTLHTVPGFILSFDTQHPSSCLSNNGPALVEGCAPLSFASCFDLASDRLRVTSDMMHDWLFIPAKGDGSGPLRVGPHNGSIWESRGGVIDKGRKRKTMPAKYGKSGWKQKWRRMWGDMHDEKMVHERRMKRRKVRMGKHGWLNTTSLTFSLVFIGTKSKKSGWLGWKLWLCSSDLRWKQRREREKKTRETKADEERWRGMSS